MLYKWVGGAGAAYYNTVWEAVRNADAYAQFRRNDVYNTVLEHVHKHEGDFYLERLHSQDFRSICFSSTEADKIGNPVTFDFQGNQISPTTLRYGKVAQDMVEFFPGFLNFRAFAEIGVGYGGQARVISEYCKLHKSKLESFTLIDMLPVVLLAQSYLDNFHLYCPFEFVTKSQLKRDRWYDFVYSNYAFAEFDRELQDEYMQNVILRSRNGYLTMNTGVPGKIWNEGAYDIHELARVLPNATILRDEPMEKTNYVLVFGDHKITNGMTPDEFIATLG